MKTIKSQNYITKIAQTPMTTVPPQNANVGAKVNLSQPNPQTNASLAKFETLFNFISAEMQNSPNSLSVQDINVVFRNPTTTAKVAELTTLITRLLQKVQMGKNQVATPGVR